MDKRLKRTIVMLVCVVGLVFFSMVLQVLDIPLPFLPSFARLQFSAVLALLGGIAYGPFTGTFIVLAKEFFYFCLTKCTFGELIASAVPDLAFVVISSVIYINIKGGVIKKTDRKGESYKKIVTRRKRIMISGVVATFVSTVLSVALTKFLEIPMSPMEQMEIVAEYSKLAGVNDVNTGLLVFNLPVAFFEYALATVVVALIYKKLSRFMHGKTVS